MKARYEAEGWEFVEYVGTRVEGAVHMTTLASDSITDGGSVTAFGVDGRNRQEKTYRSNGVLFKVAGFQSIKTGASYCMVFKKPSANAPKWWSAWMKDKVPIKEAVLAPGERKEVSIPGEGSRELGVVVNEALEMRRQLQERGETGGGVFLTQKGSEKSIGTYHSAWLTFDLAAGTEFVVENKSPVRSEVMIYSVTPGAQP